jgi:hypothetical protein
LGAKVLLLGGGDAGRKIADGLLRQGGIRQLIVADLDARHSAARVDMLNSCHPALVSFAEIDALDQAALERLLRSSRPDLIVQAASMISPWSIIGRDHPTAKILGAAGIAIQLPMQLPIVANLMRSVNELGWTIPVANLSMPDIIHPVLQSRGLAPTVGLGNVSILHLRCLAAWKRREQRDALPGEPLLRLLGHHCQVYDVMQARAPRDESHRVRVYLGERAKRDDDLAYRGQPVPPGPAYNVITAAAALPVIGALLPGADALRFSAPAPFGLPGGYPLKIERRELSLDLPRGTSLDDAIAYNNSLGRRDGVDSIGADGVVHFTAAARDAVRELDPELAEPLDCWNLRERTGRLREIVQAMGSC